MPEFRFRELKSVASIFSVPIFSELSVSSLRELKYSVCSYHLAVSSRMNQVVSSKSFGCSGFESATGEGGARDNAQESRF